MDIMPDGVVEEIERETDIWSITQYWGKIRKTKPQKHEIKTLTKLKNELEGYLNG